MKESAKTVTSGKIIPTICSASNITRGKHGSMLLEWPTHF